MNSFASVLLVLAMMFASAASFSVFKSPSFMPRRSELVMRERKCDLSGTRKNSKAMNVSKSNAHTHRVQNVNLQTRKLWWEEGNKFVRIRISARTLKTIQKNGLDSTAKKFSVDLNKFSVSSGSAVAAPLVEA